MQVKNFKVANFSFDEKDVIKMLKSNYGFLTDFTEEDKKFMASVLPADYYTVEFDLVGANTPVANAFRSVALDELWWPRLTCSIEDIVSNDTRYKKLGDYVQNRIWMVPVAHIAESEAEFEFELDATNSSKEEFLMITSSHIKQKTGPPVKWLPNIEICDLEPGTTIKIAMTLEWGINRMHSTFCPVYDICYRPLGYGNDETAERPPSYSVVPTDYHLGFSCATVLCPDPKWLTNYIWNTVSNSVIRFQKILEQFADPALKNVIPYIQDDIKITRDDRLVRFEFPGETYYTAKIITWYAYCCDETVSYLTCGDDHPDDHSIIIKVIHPEPAQLLLAGIKAALADLNKISNSNSKA